MLQKNECADLFGLLTSSSILDFWLGHFGVVWALSQTSCWLILDFLFRLLLGLKHWVLTDGLGLQGLCLRISAAFSSGHYFTMCCFMSLFSRPRKFLISPAILTTIWVWFRTNYLGWPFWPFSFLNSLLGCFSWSRGLFIFLIIGRWWRAAVSWWIWWSRGWRCRQATAGRCGAVIITDRYYGYAFGFHAFGLFGSGLGGLACKQTEPFFQIFLFSFELRYLYCLCRETNLHDIHFHIIFSFFILNHLGAYIKSPM